MCAGEAEGALYAGEAEGALCAGEAEGALYAGEADGGRAGDVRAERRSLKGCSKGAGYAVEANR